MSSCRRSDNYAARKTAVECLRRPPTDVVLSDTCRVPTVVIPAHDEEAVIGRLLSGLVDPSGATDLEILVVCNGCHDATAAVAGGFPNVRVIETPVASKQEALRLGNEAARGFPRVYVDADVELTREDVSALTRALDDPRLLAVAPRRVIPRDGTAWTVRCYYDVWEALPQVRSGIFGRGVIAVSERGYQRIAALPGLMSDDLAISSAFDEQERQVVTSATVVVRPPRTWADLIHRRVRVATGTAQAYTGDHDWRADSRTSRADLVGLVRHEPALALRMPVFLAVAVIARRRAAAAVRRGDYTTWLRDDSSRGGD